MPRRNVKFILSVACATLRDNLDVIILEKPTARWTLSGHWTLARECRV